MPVLVDMPLNPSYEQGMDPYHDAVSRAVVRNNRIAAAGCLFPLTDSPQIPRRLGTRHRAALGLAEESDAVTVVVSEETGDISACYRGTLYQNIGSQGIEDFLKKYLSRADSSQNGNTS